VTVQVEKEPEVVYKYTKEQTVVVDESTPEVIDVENNDDKAVLIPIALSVVLVTIIAYCLK
jgi:sortase (surface protein transpeptidase)